MKPAANRTNYSEAEKKALLDILQNGDNGDVGSKIKIKSSFLHHKLIFALNLILVRVQMKK